MRSFAGLTDNAAFTFTFSNAAKGFEILSAKDAQPAFLRGVGSKDLIVSGDFREVMWFQGLTAYLQPPKVTRKMEIGLRRFDEIAEDITHLHARNPHELMRAMEVSFIRDCAEMAARASLFRTESRWGLYHHRVDYPERDDANWFCHTRLYKDAHGAMASRKQAVEPYVIPVDVLGTDSYAQMRIPKAA